MEHSTPLKTGHLVGTVARATPEKRESRKCMSRRSGQSGHIEKNGNWYVVRFWMDVPGQEKRKHMCVKISPINGLGSLTKPERERKAREIIAESGADTPECLAHAEGISTGVTFRQQAAWWINHVQQRKRKPIAPATVESWQGCLMYGFYRTSAMFPCPLWGISLSKGSWKKWSRRASRPRR